MNPSAESPPPIFSPQWAIRFGAVLIAALTLVVGLASFDGMRRKQLESTTETTAVGDARYYLPSEDSMTHPVAFLDGRPLRVQQLKVEVRDTHLRRVAIDPASGLTIYELSAAATAEERERLVGLTDRYFLKLAPGEYVKVRTTSQ